MPDQPIRALPDALPLSDGDYLATDQAAPPTARATLRALRDQLQGNAASALSAASLHFTRGITRVTSNTTINSAVFQNVPLTGGTFVMPAGGDVWLRLALTWVQPAPVAGLGLYLASLGLDSGAFDGYQFMWFSPIPCPSPGLNGVTGFDTHWTGVAAGVRTITLDARKNSAGDPDFLVFAGFSYVVWETVPSLVSDTMTVLTPTSSRITEAGDYRITEGGEYRILE